MSCKVVEANAGIHSLAMAVAVCVLIPLPMKLHTDQLINSPFRAGGSMVSPVFTLARGLLVAGTERRVVAHSILSDSIYTERFMDTPQNNPGGYVNGSITSVEGFKNVDFLLAHGSGDDNGGCIRARLVLVQSANVPPTSLRLVVHFANSAHLLDMFTAAQVRRFRFRMFTDR